MKKIILLVLVIPVFLAITGCSKELEIKNTVKLYNKAMSKAYLTGDYMELRKVAVLEEQKKIGQKLKEMRDEGKKLRSNPESIIFKDVQIDSDGDNAVVTTEERWTHELLNDITEVQMSPKQRTYFEVTYSLSRKKTVDKENWLIENVTIQKEQDL